MAFRLRLATPARGSGFMVNVYAPPTLAALADEWLPRPAGFVVTLVILVEDIGVWSTAGIGPVGAAQALAVQAIMPVAETLLLAFGALPWINRVLGMI